MSDEIEKKDDVDKIIDYVYKSQFNEIKVTLGLNNLISDGNLESLLKENPDKAKEILDSLKDASNTFKDSVTRTNNFWNSNKGIVNNHKKYFEKLKTIDETKSYDIDKLIEKYSKNQYVDVKDFENDLKQIIDMAAYKQTLSRQLLNFKNQKNLTFEQKNKIKTINNKYNSFMEKLQGDKKIDKEKFVVKKTKNFERER